MKLCASSFAVALFWASTAVAQINPMIRMGNTQPDWRGFSGLPTLAGTGCTTSGGAAAAEAAIAACTRIVEQDNSRLNVARALIVRGDLYDRRSDALSAPDYQRAVELYAAEIEEQPHQTRAFVGRGAAHYRLSQYDEALGDFDRAIAIDRSFAGAFYSRAMERFRRGDYAGAIADYDRTAELAERITARGSLRTPNRTSTVAPGVHAGRCEARAAAGMDWETAEAACASAMRLSGGDSVFSRGYLYFMRGDFEQAWTDFNAAVEQDDTDGYALYGRGVTAHRLGRQDEGQADIERAAAMEGDGLAYYANAGLRAD